MKFRLGQAVVLNRPIGSFRAKGKATARIKDDPTHGKVGIVTSGGEQHYCVSYLARGGHENELLLECELLSLDEVLRELQDERDNRLKLIDDDLKAFYDALDALPKGRESRRGESKNRNE